MKPIVKWGLRQRRWSIIVWSVTVAAFIVMNLAFYPSFKDKSLELEESFSQIPDVAVALFSDTGEFFSPTGYLSSQVYYFMLPLLLGILAIGLGASLLAKEEADGTIELLLSRPISRRKLLVGKAATGLMIVGIVGFVSLVSIIVVAQIVQIDVGLAGMILATLVAILLAICFGSVAFMVAAIGRAGRGSAIGIASLYALGGYIISSLLQVADWLKYPAKLFPFKYYHPAEILNGTYDWRNLWFMVVVTCIAGFVSILTFNNRDIQ